MNWKRPVFVIGGLLVALFIGLMLTGCSSVAPREQRMCAVEEVEMEIKKGREHFEVDFKNGKEQAISKTVYIEYKRNLPAYLPCP